MLNRHLLLKRQKSQNIIKIGKVKIQLTCYSCHQLGHGIKTFIWDASKSNIKCHACGLLGHYKSNCNHTKFCKVKTAALVQGVQNVSITISSHDLNYDKFTHYGHVSNFDGSKIPIKILQYSGSLISLISSERAELCDHIDTKETMLINCITKKVLEVPIIQFKLSSNVMDRNINVGIHNQMPVGFNMLYGIGQLCGQCS